MQKKNQESNLDLSLTQKIFLRCFYHYAEILFLSEEEKHAKEIFLKSYSSVRLERRNREQKREEGEEKKKKEKRIHEERMFPCTRKTVVWHRAFYNAETRKGQLRARLSSNHLTFFSESRLPRAILPFSSLQQLLR